MRLSSSPTDQGADIDDPLALLARHPRPVVGVGRVGQILVLFELLFDRIGQVLLAHPGVLPAIWRLMASFLARRTMFSIIAPDGEVLEKEDLPVSGGIGDLEEPVLVGLAVHGIDGRGDHPVDQPGAVAVIAARDSASTGIISPR